MLNTFDIWWTSVNAFVDLSNLSQDNLQTSKIIAKEAWETSHKNSEEEIKRLQDNLDLVEQTLEDEMNLEDMEFQV